MRRFLKRLLLFALTPAAIAFTWTAFVVAMDHHSYTQGLKLAEGESIVVCGDSQTKDGLDPAIVKGLHNCSTAATTFDQDAMRLADVLEANPGKVRYVLLDASPLKVGSDMTRPVSELNAGRVHSLLHFYHFRDNRRPYGSVLALWRDVVFTRKFNEFRKSILRGKPWHSSMLGGFDPSDGCGFTSRRHRERAWKDVEGKAARFNSYGAASPELPFFVNLEEQVGRVRSAGAVPVLTTMPLSGHLRKAMNGARLADFTREMESLAKRLDVKYLDYLQLDMAEEFWHDANHLNRAGAGKFSVQFNTDLQKLVR